MISWWAGTLLLCVMLVGCGGQGGLVKQEAAPPEALQESVSLGDEDKEDSLAEELSGKRVEELYAKSGIQGMDPGIEEEFKKWEQRRKFDVPITMNRQVKAYLVYFSTERKQVISRYLSRSTRYLPMIREIFQEHGLPEDLAYLAMVESGFNPHAYSHAAACGMWQFIRGTGVRYGLSVNNYVDERRDPEKATHAAAKYLSDLYKQFGSWYLAAASYNCGEGRVQREINTSSHKNFWELSDNQCLPSETKNYVPQMIAATIIAKNPEKFGFKNISYLPPLKYEKVKVEEATSLKAVAMASGAPLEEIQTLNPELRRNVTPPEMPVYTVKIPKGAGDLFAKNIMMARAEFPGIASAPVREARIVPRKSSSWGSREVSSRKVAAGKSRGKSKAVVAKSGKKKPVQTAGAVKKGKGAAQQQPQMASVVGVPKASNGGKQVSKAKAGGKKTNGSAANAKKTAKKASES